MATSSSAAVDAGSLQARINALKASPGAVLKLEPGVYRLPKAGLVFEGLKDVVFDGGGEVTLIATDPQGTAIHVRASSGVTFRGFTLDYDPLPFTQGTITGVDRDGRTIDFKLHEGYPPLRERLEGQAAVLLSRIHVFEPNSPRWKPGAPDYAGTTVKTGERTGRASFSELHDMRWFDVGDQIAITTLSGNGVRISDGCAGLLWEDVTVHAAPFVTFTLRSNEDSGTMRRVRIVPGPTPVGATRPRLLSANADGFNSAYVRRGPLIEDCEFSHLGDDSINLHGPMLPVAEWAGAEGVASGAFHAILAARNNRVDLLSRSGDEIRFLRAPDYRIVATRRIDRVERIEMDAVQWVPFALKLWGPSSSRPKPETISVFRVSFASAAGELDTPDARLEEPDGLFVDFPALAAPGYVIRNNHFHDHRARGLRIMASDGLIAGNRIERIKQVGISIGPEYAFWREAGWVNNVVVENNILRDIAEGSNAWSPAAYTLGAISTMARMDPVGAGKTPPAYYAGNRNIVIRNNVIENSPLDAIHLVAAEEPVVSGNRLKNVATLDDAAKRTAGGDHGMSVGDGVTIVR